MSSVQPVTTWNDLLAAVDFAAEHFRAWATSGRIPAHQAQAIATHYKNARDVWEQASKTGGAPPLDSGLPPGPLPPPSPERARRLWWFLGFEIHRQNEAGRLSLATTHALLTEGKERVAAIDRQLAAERSQNPGATTAAAPARPTAPSGSGAGGPAAAPRPPLGLARPPAAPAVPKVPSRSLLEILLDPRSIQWLLAFGGALMVVGLVILLWVNEFFTPPVVAISLGVVNAALLVGGWAMIKKSRHQTAGRALTLLACLVMPLNLWYYHAQGLMTLDGHLWVAGLACFALYAATAYLIRDEVFVYVFSAGVTLTGLLILADWPPSPEWFLEVHPPATLLVVLGLLAIHAERAFPEGEGPFTRQRFGLAFFYSGHVQLAAGLLLILGAQLAGHWLYEPIFKPLFLEMETTPSPLVGELRWLALVLVIAATYAYIYSDVVVRHLGFYVYVAGATLLWSEVLLLEWLNLAIGIDAVIAVLALTALAVNLLHATVAKDSRLTRAFPVMGVLLCVMPVLLGVYVYLRALSSNLQAVWETSPPTWSYVGAMLLAAVACRVGAHLVRHTQPRLSMAYFFLAAAATLVAAVALLAALGFQTWQSHAPILMLIPIGYLIAARLWRGHAAEKPLVWVSHVATGVMLLSSAASSLRGFALVEGDPLNLSLAAFFAEAALFYGLATAWKQPEEAAYGAGVAASAAVWQLLTYFSVDAEYYTIAFAVAGLVLLAAYRFAVVEKVATPRWALAAFQVANVVLSLSFVAAVLMGLSRLATDVGVDWEFVAVCITLVAASGVAVLLVQHPHWRRWYVVTTIGLALLTFLAVQYLSTLGPWQKVELFSVAAGVLLLVASHLGWYRERERQSDLVDLGLWLGALMAGVPLAIATLIDRSLSTPGASFSGFLVFNELGFLAISVLLLGTGFVFRLKATTIVGAALTCLYFLTLLIYIPWGRLNTVATCLTIGGGLLFGTGIVLSLYRDRLLALPERIKNRQGLFRVLTWR